MEQLFGHTQGFSHEEYSRALSAGHDDRDIKEYLDKNPQARVASVTKKGRGGNSATDFAGGGGWYDTMLKGADALDKKDQAHQERLDGIRNRKGKGIEQGETEEKSSEVNNFPKSQFEEKFEGSFKKFQDVNPNKQSGFNNSIKTNKPITEQSNFQSVGRGRTSFQRGKDVDIYKRKERSNARERAQKRLEL